MATVINSANQCPLNFATEATRPERRSPDSARIQEKKTTTTLASFEQWTGPYWIILIAFDVGLTHDVGHNGNGRYIGRGRHRTPLHMAISPMMIIIVIIIALTRLAGPVRWLGEHRVPIADQK